MDALKGKHARGFPKVITGLPEADVRFKGIRAWIAQGEKHQIVFFEMESGGQMCQSIVMAILSRGLW